MKLEITENDTFSDLLSAAALESRAYARTLETFEAVDQLEEIRRIGDQVLLLVRGGRVPRDAAETLLVELMVCFADPLGQLERLHRIEQIVRSYDQ